MCTFDASRNNEMFSDASTGITDCHRRDAEIQDKEKAIRKLANGNENEIQFSGFCPVVTLRLRRAPKFAGRTRHAYHEQAP
jgi:hypothetical protein